MREIDVAISYLQKEKKVINLTDIGNDECVWETKRSRQVLKYDEVLDMRDKFATFDKIHNTK